jgi:hypothetical protein
MPFTPYAPLPQGPEAPHHKLWFEAQKEAYPTEVVAPIRDRWTSMLGAPGPFDLAKQCFGLAEIL